MNTRFYNGKILTMEESTGIIEGELWVEGKRVSYAGPQKPTTIKFDKEIDLTGNLVMPGFKNAHTHSGMTFLRSYADGLPLLEWLDKQVFPMEAMLRPEQAYFLNILAIMEYLASGITAAMDMYFYPEDMARASVDCGFRTVITGGVSNFVGSLQAMENDFLRFRDYHELISSMIGFHAEYTCSENLLRGVAGVSERLGVPVYTHNSESRQEVEDCLARTGMTPTAYLDSLGIFGNGGGCYHCVHMTEADLQILRNRNVTAITCPASNSKLASGIAPVSDMLDAGITVAIGTDGSASNNALDMFREMYLSTVLQKLLRDDASALDAGKVLQMATRDGARVMGIADCDTLAPGKLADLIVIDLRQPNMQPLNNIINHIVYAGGKHNITLTMVNGNILYENGSFHIGADPEDIYDKANFIISNMKRI